MKSKILSFSFLAVSLGLVFVTMSSNDNGNTSSGGTSCGSCHGNTPSTSTTVTLTGLPTTYIAGQTYNLTFTASNTNTALNHGGFNIKCSSGQFTAGTGSITNTAKDQITHNAVSATNSWTFSWKAPATPGSVTFNCVGNCVNNDGSDSPLDMWNTATYTLTGTFAVNVEDITEDKLSIYPNPAQNQITLKGTIANPIIFNVCGQVFSLPKTSSSDKTTFDISSLAPGIYFVKASADGKMASGSFSKN